MSATNPTPAEDLPVLPTNGTIDPFRYLKANELKQAKELAKALNTDNPLAVSNFATKAQGEMAALSGPIMKVIATKDSGPVGEVLTDLLTQVKALNAGSLAAQSESLLVNAPVIGKFFNKIQRFIQQYEAIAIKIEHITTELSKSRRVLSRDIILLENVYNQNKLAFRLILTHIAAGKLKLEELGKQYDELAEKARASNDLVVAQQAQDLRSVIARMERRVYDLELSATVALQTAPQIRLVQNGDQALVEKIDTSINTTIPLWQNQVIIAIGLFDQKKSLRLQRAVTYATNELLLRNANLLRLNSTEVAAESERGVVEIETLKTVNEQLIDTIEETIQIQEEGHQKRLQAEVELEELHQQLRDKLTEVRKREIEA